MPRTLTHARLDEDIEIDDGSWYCVNVNEYRCPDCRTLVEFAHISLQRHPAIIIAEAKDDDILLEIAIVAQQLERNPKIIEYEPDFGLSITVEELCKMLGVHYEC